MEARAGINSLSDRDGVIQLINVSSKLGGTYLCNVEHDKELTFLDKGADGHRLMWVEKMEGLAKNRVQKD